ncbi:hypothetical protein CTKA_02053 [Chthonomonas calidirosea]|uniref:Caspase domain n=1 Tax=Chthonomonas calidirosea (strain DSM 23976 / ICMP 18418 / T49) TaxID=1303518 RepID=S0EVL7_CHTCT|nr:hypothetical protein [Chthonomonas calidirosea]CCW35849.1 hypothetical protein CCALI_02042 [Chthonomonas calidirosea T49]CEK19063.1 hypothetical protein CTKA_02053 [Chthonomonas calidirosea]
MKGIFWVRRLLFSGAFLLLCGGLSLPQETQPPLSPPDNGSSLNVLIVGGGPEPDYNQVAIESNVRYVQRLLPANAQCTTLFADGDPKHDTIYYTDPAPISIGQHLYDLLIHEDSTYSADRYRPPHLLRGPDGPSRLSAIRNFFDRMHQQYTTSSDPAPLLLYFTGHGSPDRPTYANNRYDLWKPGPDLDVHTLASLLEQIPPKVPVTLIMVQCFSGGFADLLFGGGDPERPYLDRDLVGFFAALPQREAAGCTSEVNEAEYHDFTSYFFAALTGRDRLGHPVTGADYNHDGRVGMDEAFCYTLIHDPSIDTPVCTSDVFLRHFVQASDQEVFSTPWHDLLRWASPAQRAALEAISDQLQLQGESRAQTAFNLVQDDSNLRTLRARFANAESELEGQLRDDKAILIANFPKLRGRGADREAAKQEAIDWLAQNAQQSPWKDLLEAEKRLENLDAQEEQAECVKARQIRFVRLCKSVVLAHKLLAGQDDVLKERYLKLTKAEGRSLLPPAPAFTETLSQTNTFALQPHHILRPCGCGQSTTHLLKAY